MEQQVSYSYVWPENLEHRLLLADAVAQIEGAAARIRKVAEPMVDEDRKRFADMMCGVICAEVGARHIREVLAGEDGRAG